MTVTESSTASSDDTMTILRARGLVLTKILQEANLARRARRDEIIEIDETIARAKEDFRLNELKIEQEKAKSIPWPRRFYVEVSAFSNSRDRLFNWATTKCGLGEDSTLAHTISETANNGTVVLAYEVDWEGTITLIGAEDAGDHVGVPVDWKWMN